MKYSIDWLRTKYYDGEKIKYLFFFGSKKSDEVTKSCFSQWYESPFTVDGILYPTAEHWMMAKKAELFKDSEMLDNIIASKGPGEAKEFGRKVKGFDPATWDEHKFQIVVEGNKHKFSQAEELSTFLKNTKKRVLVEASPRDTIWGIGRGTKSEGIENPDTWRGQNLLGFALMEVRDWLNEK